MKLASKIFLSQAMVFGNMNNKSGVGIRYTRNPSSGEDVICGEYVVNAEGEEAEEGVRPAMTVEVIA